MSCIKGVIFSILINGHFVILFKNAQGVRQGDPLFPFLFILMEEALRQSISTTHENNNWICIQILHTSISLTHSPIVDDTL